MKVEDIVVVEDLSVKEQDLQPRQNPPPPIQQQPAEKASVQPS
jgi:hypothetical protein